MDLVQVAQSKPIDKEFIRYMNSLRCPLCQSQLDGKIHPDRSVLYCVGNPSEYQCEYNIHSKLPVRDQRNIFYSDFKYEIICDKISSDQFRNLIYKVDLSLLKRFQQIEKKKMFENSGNRLPDFSRPLSQEDFLKKVKLYNLFS